MKVGNSRQPVTELSRVVTATERWSGKSRGATVVVLALLAFAMTNPMAALATRGVWTTVISASCTNVTAGNNGEAQGNLLDKTGKLLLVDGSSAAFGQFCGTSQSVTTSKEPFSSPVIASATNSSGVPICTFGGATVPVPGTATFTSNVGCPFVGSLTLTLSQPVKS